MSGLTVELVHDPRWGWFFDWHGETFYDEFRYLRCWPTTDEAEAWLLANHPDLHLVRPRGLQYALPVKS